MGPLQERLNSHNSRAPTPEERKCFEELKRILTDEKEPVLMLPDFEKPFYILFDAASTVGYGAVLCQMDDSGHERPVAYHSRRWKDAETRWHSLEHECCAMYESVKRFSAYLGDSKFYLITDAEPLVWLRSMKNPKGKFATWTMELQCYDFEVFHRPGELHRAADALSRLAKLMPEERHSIIRPIIEAAGRQADAPPMSTARSIHTVSAGAPATGAAFASSSFRRKRVTAVVFTSTELLVHRVDGDQVQLPATCKLAKLEPLREAAARALEHMFQDPAVRNPPGSGKFGLFGARRMAALALLLFDCLGRERLLLLVV
ncbi:hypothetical protein AB1Y20_016489 [Prymnesium parvum]|uniref:Reverse transcriptase RNase H-like domain-containing protein n=1 Tax=Prymnesium parvum TaxID=97485 RepID=A0AB34ICX7_PRYPA